MKIFILTKNRVGKQLTLANLPLSLYKDTYLVCPKEEAEQHKHQSWNPPDHVKGVCMTRQWIIENAENVFGEHKIFMLDDDLSFNIRIPASTKLRKIASDAELYQAFDLMYRWMDEIPVVGMSTRQGNNTVEEGWADNTRILRFFGINTREATARFDRLRVMEDYDFLLQMLRQGKQNRVLYLFSQDQPASGSAGGCSDYRTLELQAECANKLADLHPRFVKVVQKQPKTGWLDGQPRTDVTIYWKKAFKSSGVVL